MSLEFHSSGEEISSDQEDVQNDRNEIQIHIWLKKGDETEANDVTYNTDRSSVPIVRNSYSSDLDKVTIRLHERTSDQSTLERSQNFYR